MSLMRETRGNSHQIKSPTEFKLWSNNFDGLRFLYDHLNATEDVNKVKSIGAQQLTQNLSAYLIRCVIITRGLFEVGEAYEKNELHLNKEVNHLKDTPKIQFDKIEDLVKQLDEMTKKKNDSES